MINTMNHYQTLGLSEGASLSDVKAAFRRLAKAHHPDADGRTQADVDQFIKVQTSYQKLLKTAIAQNHARRARQTMKEPWQSATTSAAPAADWRFDSRREAGLDVHYRLFVLRPAEGGVRVVLPWQAQDACPRCLGQGRTLARVGSLYRPCACSKCGGQGAIVRDSQLEVVFTPDMVGQSKIRLRKAGLYNAQAAQRGDLFLEITWVDHLPRPH